MYLITYIALDLPGLLCSMLVLFSRMESSQSSLAVEICCAEGRQDTLGTISEAGVEVRVP